MLYTLRFTAELDHTVDVEALDLDEAISQTDDLFNLPDCAHLVQWHYASATVAGETVQEEPRLHEQHRDEVTGLEAELNRLRTQLAERDQHLARLWALMEMAQVFKVDGPNGTATVTRQFDGWFVTSNAHGWSQHLTRDDAMNHARQLVN
ncbi:hypothetical protein NE857_09340 [Nocardiopsis exhalans]|uniref:Uncharacterized protein n=1 Tax=Nocardiopsis exhalans TaxID=163604 RepID=A0ABY5DFI9_9ACTN|nr:hypothetical protein [Nocardiopsis exhalans]USY21785.1 hypothetical protein NE857_09340 [Nocardiopsis exhalans]